MTEIETSKVGGCSKSNQGPHHLLDEKKKSKLEKYFTNANLWNQWQQQKDLKKQVNQLHHQHSKIQLIVKHQCFIT